MDALFHFTMSFTGGYLLLKCLRKDFRWSHLLLLSLIAGLIDVDHITGSSSQALVLHNLTFVIGAPMILFLAFRYLKRERLRKLPRPLTQ